MHNLDKHRKGKIFGLCVSGILIFLLAVTICGCGQRLSERMENVEQETSGESNSLTQAEEGCEGVNSLIGGKIEAVAATGALLLNGEYGDLHEKIVADGHRNSDAYTSFQKVLQDIRDANGATYVYTLIKVSNKMTNLIVDAAEGEDADDYGTPYEMEPQWEKSFAGEPAYEMDAWEDEWQGGMMKTASAPIYNGSGEIVAILSVDYPIDDDLAYATRLYGERTMAIAVTGALLLNGEYGDLHEKIVADGHRNSEAYTSFQKILQDIQDTNGATYVYTLIKLSDDMTSLITDAAEGADADPYGTTYEMESLWEKSFAGEPAYAPYTWEDEWQGGMLQTASAPIYNSNGEVVAILSIDYPVPLDDALLFYY